MIIAAVFFILLCSAMNRARGSQFWNMVPSTVGSRLLAMGTMAIALSAIKLNMLYSPVVLGGMMLWCTPGWDKYWSEEIGNSATHSRLYGLMQMACRQMLILPCLAAVAQIAGGGDHFLYCLGAPLLALPYYIIGGLYKAESVELSEYVNGAIIGMLLLQLI